MGKLWCRVGALACGLLTACGGSGTADRGPSLPYATDDRVLADAVGTPVPVTLVRYETDYGTGVTRLVTSDEVLTLTSFDGAGRDLTFTLSLRGEVLDFAKTGYLLQATDGAGKVWEAYTNTLGAQSGTVGVYAYDFGGGAGDFDTEGFFVFGYGTDPATLAARTTAATYSGDFHGIGGVVDQTGAIVLEEAIGSGSIVLNVDFDAMQVAGDLSGSFEGFGAFEAGVNSAAIVGNGFASTLSPECGSGVACSSNTLITGSFYGPDAGEASGLIAFDETVTTVGSGAGLRLLSGAGFTLTPGG